MTEDLSMVDREAYSYSANKILLEKYSIRLEDTGYTNEEWLNRFGDMEVEDAVKCFAEKYDLISREELLLSANLFKDYTNKS